MLKLYIYDLLTTSSKFPVTFLLPEMQKLEQEQKYRTVVKIWLEILYGVHVCVYNAHVHISSHVTTIPPESPAHPFVWSETWCCPWNVLFEQFPSFWRWHAGVFVLLATHFKAGLQLIVNDLAAFLEINPTGISTNTDRVMHHTQHRSPDRYYFSTNSTGRDYFCHFFQT